MTEEKMKQFEEAAKPLVKFLCENFNPHTTATVTPSGAELLEGLAVVHIPEFIKD